MCGLVISVEVICWLGYCMNCNILCGIFVFYSVLISSVVICIVVDVGLMIIEVFEVRSVNILFVGIVSGKFYGGMIVISVYCCVCVLLICLSCILRIGRLWCSV